MSAADGEGMPTERNYLEGEHPYQERRCIHAIWWDRIRFRCQRGENHDGEHQHEAIPDGVGDVRIGGGATAGYTPVRITWS